MIQRIQTVFLALAAAACLVLYAVPFATTPEGVMANEIFADSQYNLSDHFGLILFFTLAAVLAVAGIFLYKNRQLQMRLTIFSIIALVVGIAFCLIYYMNNDSGLENADVDDGLGAYLPFIAIVFALLAYRNISKDDKLVRSMDRLR